MSHRPIVIDASAAVSFVLKDDRSESILPPLLEGRLRLVPKHYVVEVASSLWKYAAAGRITLSQAHHLHRRALELVDGGFEVEDLISEALTEAVQRKHPVYDLVYLVLCRRYDAPILTLDRRLARLAEDVGIEALGPYAET